MIGLIIPPGQIKKLLQKTAQHVAVNGSEFQKILIEREQNKPQFAFLRAEHPFRAYYDFKVAQNSKKLLQNMTPEEENKEEQKDEGKIKEEIAAIKEEAREPEVLPDQKTFLENVFMELKEPDPEKYLAEIPQKLSEADQAMIMHTAQYAARNGKNFTVALREREKNNPQFEFLRTSSKHNEYFQRMVVAYTNILDMETYELQQLNKFIKSKEEIFSKCKAAYQYHIAKQQQARGRKEQEAKKVKESNIDWNDFELVETITFEEDINKYMPSELLSRAQQVPVAPRAMEETIITQPKKRREILQQCHACRQNILASEMNKHLKTCLAHKKRATGQNDAQQGEDVDIRKNLEGLSIRRPDIFGSQGNQISAEDTSKREDKVAYDGQGANISKLTGTMAILEFEKSKLKKEQAQQKK